MTHDNAFIHPTAIVDPAAQLEKDVSIGPYCIVEANVQIGQGTSLMHHASVHQGTEIGKNNKIYPYASLGNDPQDKKYKPNQSSLLKIGNDNVIRQFVTIDRGTVGATSVGDGNTLLVYCHIGHDCQVGNDIIMSGGAVVAGYVQLEDHCTLSGYTAVHQFCKIGRYVMTGVQSFITQDVPPCVIAAGNRARLYGINRVGLERGDIDPNEIKALQDMYRIFFASKLRSQDALEQIEDKLGSWSQVKHFVEFVRKSERGITR